MPTMDRFLKTSPQLAAAALASASGVMMGAAPAQAVPPVPLAPPAGCAQWGFPGVTTFTNAGGVAMRFNSTGPTASGPAEFNPNGIFKNGTIAGGIDADGKVNVTFTDDDVDDPGSAAFIGNVGPDGKVTSTNTNWTVLEPMVCVTQKVLQGPTAVFTTIPGGLSVDITDHSGVASNCQYKSEIVSRSFSLKANGTTNLRIIPAIPLFTDRAYDITCDNGTETHDSTFF